MALLARIHGLYYLATGLWPVVDVTSFQAVTGDKTDLWLVKTVGLLIAVIGAAVLVSGRERPIPGGLVLLAAGSALALGSVDVYYSARGVISKVYLLDAPVEAALAAAWFVLRVREGKKRRAGAEASAPALSKSRG